VTIKAALSYYSIHCQLTSTQYAKILGAKFDGLTLNCATGPLEITLDFKALRYSIITASVTGTLPTEEPYEYFHGCVSWDTDTTVIANSLSAKLARSTEAVRGIECMTATNKRVMSEIIEKMAKVDGSVTMVVQNTDAINDVLGGTSISDTLDTFDIVFTFTRDASNDITLTLSDCKVSSVSGGIDQESGERTYEVSYLALDMDAEVNVT
jgi:hypothetical protein